MKAYLSLPFVGLPALATLLAAIAVGPAEGPIVAGPAEGPFAVGLAENAYVVAPADGPVEPGIDACFMQEAYAVGPVHSTRTPMTAAPPEPETSANPCYVNNQCTREDFALLGMFYRYDAFEDRGIKYGDHFWYFQDPQSYVRAGAEVILTWELPSHLVGTPCGNHIMANAAYQNPAYVRIWFHDPMQEFSGAVQVLGNNRIRKTIPLGSLQPSNVDAGQYGISLPPGMESAEGNHYRLHFGIMYQEDPTCLTYQRPNPQFIAFASPPAGAGWGPVTRNGSVLRWNTHITVETLGETPHPIMERRTISEMVNSVFAARLDGQACNNCHNNGGVNRYRPPVGSGPSTPGLVTPSTQIERDRGSTYRWSDPGGIVHAFDQALGGSKPEHIKAVLEKWAADGYLDGE